MTNPVENELNEPVEEPGIPPPPVAPPPKRRKGRSLLSSAAWNLVALAALGVMSFITVPLIVRAVGDDGYGLYLLVGMVGGFAGLLDLGLAEATLKYIAQSYARDDIAGVNRVLGATLGVYTGMGLLGGAAIVLAAPWIVSLFYLRPEQVAMATVLVRLAGPAFVLSIVAGVLRAVPEALQRFDVSSKVRIAVAFVQSVGMVAAAKLGYGARGLVVWMVGSTVVAVVLSFTVAVRMVPGLHPWPRPTRSGVREVFGYGVFSFLNQVIGTLAAQIDRLILGMFFGPADVTALSVPKNLLVRGMGIYAAPGAALMPRFSALEDPAEIRRLYLHGTWSLLCLSLAVFVPTSVVMPEFLSLWISPQFAARAGLTAQIIASTIAIQGAFVPYFSLLRGTGRVRWLTVISFSTTGLGIVAAVVLIRWMGLVGAGWRLWVTAWCGIIVTLIVCRRLFRDIPLRMMLFRILLAPMATAGAIAMLFGWAWGELGLHGWPSLIVAWMACFLVLATTLWFTGRMLTGPSGPAAQLYTSARAWLVAVLTRRRLIGRR